MRWILTALLSTTTPALAQDWAFFDRLPEGAVEVDEATARRLVAAGDLVPAGTRAPERDDAALLDAFLARRPELRAAFAASARLEPAPTLELADRHAVTLGGGAALRRDLAASLHAASDPTTVLRTHAWLADLATRAGRRVPSVAGWSTDEIRALNREILNDYNNFASLVRRPDRRLDPLDGTVDVHPEVLQGQACVGGLPPHLGEGVGSDRQDIGVGLGCGLSPDGIVARDPRPYVHRLGCVKDQGRRGACVGFAVASALEVAFAEASQQRLDLSEQHLYALGKLAEPVSEEDHFRDGLNTQDTLERLAQRGAVISFESGWNYNPSLDRQGFDSALNQYPDACLGYPETCSEWVHQAELLCFRPTGQLRLACGWQVQGSTWGLALGAPGLQLWDADHAATSLEAVKAALDSGQQVVLGMMVNDPIKAAAKSDGFVAYQGENVSLFGWHAVHVVAYILNSELADIAPDAPPGSFGPSGQQGEGGYLIARNSWGPCSGDGGYLYLPFRWVKAGIYTTSAVALSPDDLAPAYVSP